MNFVAKMLIGLVLAGGAIRVWHGHEREVIDRELAAASDSNGFVSIAMPDGAQQDKVLIFAALNCPSAQARRADEMAAKLQRMGIPIQRSNHFSISQLSAQQMPLLTRTNAVMGGPIPIVLVNGMAKNDPTVDEVALEYHRDK